MKEKNFLKSLEEIEKSIIPPMGYALVTDRITVDGKQIGYMYREIPDNKQDSGWRFFSGDEDEDYLDNEINLEVMSVNTIAHYDKDIIPFLESPYETAFGRNEANDFVEEEFQSTED